MIDGLEGLHQVFANLAEVHTEYRELALLIETRILKLLTLLAHHLIFIQTINKIAIYQPSQISWHFCPLFTPTKF
jgi:hypothetical protein